MNKDLNSRETLTRYRHTPKGILTNIYQHIKHRSRKYGYPLTLKLKDIHLFLKNKKFKKLFKEWEERGYKYYDKPSIDRIDAYKGYTKENIQILSWKENRIKGDKEVAIKKHKPVIMLEMDGVTILNKFSSIKEAVAKTGLNQSLISHVCNGKRNHTGGYKFKFGNIHEVKK